MNLFLHTSVEAANAAAAEWLGGWLTTPGTRNIMVAGGQTPLDLYGRIAERNLSLRHLQVFALDEYVGVPRGESRNCANLIRRVVINAWNIPDEQFFAISSLESEALASVQAHERRIETTGLDVIILGLGQNGHLGFNEPGSTADSVGRVLQLEPISVEANRKWFGGDYAPNQGVTVGLKTVLSAKRTLLMAYGEHKAAAVHAMVEGPRCAQCPASFLQGRAGVRVFLDPPAAAGLNLAAIETE